MWRRRSGPTQSDGSRAEISFVGPRFRLPAAVVRPLSEVPRTARRRLDRQGGGRARRGGCQRVPRTSPLQAAEVALIDGDLTVLALDGDAGVGRQRVSQDLSVQGFGP